MSIKNSRFLGIVNMCFHSEFPKSIIDGRAFVSRKKGLEIAMLVRTFKSTAENSLLRFRLSKVGIEPLFSVPIFCSRQSS